MRIKKKKKQENEEPVLTPENFYGNMRYRGTDIEDLLKEYARVFPLREFKSEYGYPYGIEHPSGFNITFRWFDGQVSVSGAYRATEGLVWLRDYQVDNLVDKLYPMLVKEIADENLRISQKIDNIGRTHENQGVM